jgi:hypothetical protein
LSASDFLILNIDDFGANVQRFFKTLEQSDAHKQLFVSDPSGVITKMLLPDVPFSESTINDANRILYSMLSNAKFMKWANEYQQKLYDEALETTKIKDPDEAMKIMTALFDKRKIYADLVQGLIDSGDKEIVGTIIVARGTPGTPTKNPPRYPGRGTPADPTPNPVLIETIIVGFLLEIVCVIVLIGVVMAILRPPGPIDGVSRDDLLKLSAALGKQLEKKASEQRRSGKLSL